MSMKAILIAGGIGSRLRPLTYSRPKHLLPVANRPLLDYQIALLARYGVREILFASNYMADQIEARYRDSGRNGQLRSVREPFPLGTAGAIRNAVPQTQEPVIVLNGDILTDLDLGSLLAFHRESGASATIAVRAVPRPHAFGVLITDSDGRVREWREPSEEQKQLAARERREGDAGTDLINAGIYVLEPEVISQIPAGRAVSIERETYPALIASGARLFAFPAQGYWIDIGNPRQYLAANRAVALGDVRTDLAIARIDPGARIHGEARVDAASVLGPGVALDAGVRITGSVLLEDVTVAEDAVVEESILDRGSRVESECVLRSVVLGEDSVVSRGTRTL